MSIYFGKESSDIVMSGCQGLEVKSVAITNQDEMSACLITNHKLKASGITPITLFLKLLMAQQLRKISAERFGLCMSLAVVRW